MSKVSLSVLESKANEMTDSDRLNALHGFALPGHVWIRNQVRNKEILSTVCVPLRSVPRHYAERFNVPFWESLREAIDSFIEEAGKPVAGTGKPEK